MTFILSYKIVSLTWHLKLHWWFFKSVLTLWFAPRQAVDVSRRQTKVRESAGNPELIMKLEAAESKLHELKGNVATLGKEAAAAMSAVEGQQQRFTLQRLLAMVMHSCKPLHVLLRIWKRNLKLQSFKFGFLWKGWSRAQLSSESSTDTWSAWKRGMKYLKSFEEGHEQKHRHL